MRREQKFLCKFTLRTTICMAPVQNRLCMTEETLQQLNEDKEGDADAPPKKSCICSILALRIACAATTVSTGEEFLCVADTAEKNSNRNDENTNHLFQTVALAERQTP
mmetsp:Transcript_23052/g.41637  ORF Transcript_23052/g.41637 Transcript_23052/m.41637 type:complete len:108 (+) Transcript_23052:454-777(+)